MRVTLRQLQVFSAVAERLSYTAAAEALHLTQPAVFAQVRQLEAQVGEPLIARAGRRLMVTEAGALVLRSAAAILAEADRLEAGIAALRGLSAGRLDLAVVSTAKYTLPWLIGPFSRAHPGIDIRLTVGNRRELLERFADHRDDLYVLGALPDDLDADHVPLAENLIVVVAAPDHPLAGRVGVALADLAAFPLVMRETGSGTRRAAEAQFAEAGLVPRIHYELGANEAVKQAVIAGLGPAILSRGTVELELAHGYLVELDVAGFPLRRSWSMAWSRARPLSRAAEALRAALVAGIEPGKGTSYFGNA
ncbi:MAG: LysR family transcriptional regulator [Roseovarius sp.]|nr:LysR family transcriptional regulator [Roseovarius sp.]